MGVVCHDSQMGVTANVQTERAHGVVAGDGGPIGRHHRVVHFAPMNGNVGSSRDAKADTGSTNSQDTHLDPVADHNRFVGAARYDEHASSTHGMATGQAESAGTT